MVKGRKAKRESKGQFGQMNPILKLGPVFQSGENGPHEFPVENYPPQRF